MLYQLLHQAGQLLCWFVVVAPWEQALRIRLGKRVTLLRAGTYLRIPVIDRMYRQTVRRRFSGIGPVTLTTSDGRSVTLSGCVGFEIEDVLKLYNTVHQPSDTINAEISGIISQYVATHSYDECTPIRIQQHVIESVDLSRYGLGGVEFFISNFLATKTYRFVMGDANSWMRNGEMQMGGHEQPGQPATI